MAEPSQAAEPVSESDDRWREAAKELTPEKSLARAAETARFLVGAVSGVGALLTVFGVVTAAQVPDSPLVLAPLVLTAVLSCGSVAVALWALLTRTRSVRPGNLVEVEKWFTDEIRRKGRALFAGWLLIGAFVTAVLAGGAALWAYVQAEPSCSIALSMTVTSDGNVVRAVANLNHIERHDKWRADLSVDGQRASVATGISAQIPSTVATLETVLSARPNNVVVQVQTWSDGQPEHELCRAALPLSH